MNAYQATGLAEGFIEAENEEQVIEAWQFLIDTGLCWRLQGWFGRRARDLIEQGVCHEAGYSPEHMSAVNALVFGETTTVCGAIPANMVPFASTNERKA